MAAAAPSFTHSHSCVHKQAVGESRGQRLSLFPFQGVKYLFQRTSSRLHRSATPSWKRSWNNECLWTFMVRDRLGVEWILGSQSSMSIISSEILSLIKMTHEVGTPSITQLPRELVMCTWALLLASCRRKGKGIARLELMGSHMEKIILQPQTSVW